MSLAGLMTYTVTILRRSTSTQDEYGDPVSTYTTAGTTPAWIEQTGTREQLIGENRVLSDWLLILPVGTVLAPYDRILHDGKTFEVVGEPALAASPNAASRHVEAPLRIVEG